MEQTEEKKIEKYCNSAKCVGSSAVLKKKFITTEEYCPDCGVMLVIKSRRKHTSRFSSRKEKRTRFLE
jgi:predicted RNA-binding Zn-ribbon protein involved in translation (DUF1610 family)